MPGPDGRVPRGIARRELQAYAASGLLTLDEAGPTEADLRRARRIRPLSGGSVSIRRAGGSPAPVRDAAPARASGSRASARR
jgi:hypothetical protein